MFHIILEEALDNINEAITGCLKLNVHRHAGGKNGTL
jgi:hypothetical protein